MTLARATLVATLALAPLAEGRAAVDPDRLLGLRARNIGPSGMSGRVAAIEGVPSDPDTVYVGAASGGVWKSANGGLTWEPIFDDQPVHSIGAIAVDPGNPDVVWVGTGEGNMRNSVSAGNGVYRSADGGKTWQHLGLEKTERIHRIAVHPQDGRVAYVCAPGPLWGDGAERGVFKTDDGGKTWRKVLFVDEKTGCGDLAMDPANPHKVLAALWQFRRWPYTFKSGGPGSGVYVTQDAGANWKRLTEEDGLPRGELGRAGIAVSRSNPEVVYLLVEAETSALLRSDDGGRRFKVVNDKPNVNPRPFYYADLRVDPARPDRVYTLATLLRVSNDGGRTFEPLKGAGQREIHVDHHALWIAPGDPRRLYLGNDGGVAESRDRGETFRFVENLPLAQYYHVALDDQRPYHIYGGLQDNNSWRGPSAVWQRGGIRNHEWKPIGVGDGFEALPDRDDPSRGYSLWQGGNLLRWDSRTGVTKAIKPTPAAGQKLRFNWNAALALDPVDPATVYLGSQFVHRSTDRGESWAVISPDLTTNNPEWQKQDQSGGITLDVTAAENYTSLVALAPSPVEKGVIWAGSDDGRIHVTRDAGGSWTSVEGGLRGAPAHTWVAHIEASKHRGGEAFAVLDNHRRGDFEPYVFRTENYGKTWTRLATAGVRGWALVVEQDPVKPELVFLGTELGLYVSFDGGKSFSALKKTLPTASVMDLAIHPRDHDLVIATHGRALWVLDDIRPLRALTESALNAPLTLFEPAPAQQHWRRPADAGFGAGAGEFKGANRDYGALLTYSLNVAGLPLPDPEKDRERPGPDRKDGGRPEVDVRVSDASGRLLRAFKGPARLGLNRVAWDLARDAPRQFPRAEDAPPLPEPPSGPEVPPGAYTVAVKFREHEQRANVLVLADPRYSNSAADWERRWEAVSRAAALNDQAVEAALRLRRARDDVKAIQDRWRQGAEGLSDPAEKKKVEEHALVKDGDALKKALGEMENRLWSPPETRGIVARTRVVHDIQTASGALASSWDPPNANQLELLRQAEERLLAFRQEADRFFAADVAAYGKRAAEAGVGLLTPSGGGRP